METEEKFLNNLSELLVKSEDEFWNEFFCHDFAEKYWTTWLLNKVKELIEERKKDLKFN